MTHPLKITLSLPRQLSRRLFAAATRAASRRSIALLLSSSSALATSSRLRTSSRIRSSALRISSALLSALRRRRSSRSSTRRSSSSRSASSCAARAAALRARSRSSCARRAISSSSACIASAARCSLIRACRMTSSRCTARSSASAARRAASRCIERACASPKFGGPRRERYVGGSEDVRVTGDGALGRSFSRPCASEWERAISVGGKADGGIGMASSIALTVSSSRRETVNVACGRWARTLSRLLWANPWWE